MKRIAVLGAGGMLGYAVARYFERQGDRVVRLTRAEYDIARDPLDKLAALLDGVDWVVNCAGVIKPLIAQARIEDVLRVNAVFPRNLGLLARQADFRTFHVTTDCVYSGSQGSYTEEDPFDADDVYGMSKNGGDTADNMTLRTSIIGEERGQSRSLLEWARSQAGRQVKGFKNHRWNGVTTVHLAELIERIVERGLHEHGVFHVHSPQAVDKYELLSLINGIYELGLKIEAVDAPQSCDRSLASRRPLNAALNVKPLRQQIEEMRRFFAA